MKEKTKLSKILFAFLAMIVLFTNGISDVSASGNDFPNSDLSIKLIVPDNQIGAEEVDIKIEIAPSITGFAELTPETTNDVVIEVTLPHGATIDPNQFGNKIEIGKDGEGNAATINATVVDNKVIITVENFYYWKNYLESNPGQDYAFGFKASNLFQNFSYTDETSAQVAVSYLGTEKVSKTVNSIQPTLSWSFSATSAGTVAHTATEPDAGEKVIVTTNAGVGITTSTSYAHSSASSVLLKKTDSVTIQQVINVPADVTLNKSDIEASQLEIAGSPVSGSTVTVSDFDAVNRQYTVTWSIPSLPTDIQASQLKTSLRLTGFSYQADAIFPTGATGSSSRVLYFDGTGSGYTLTVKSGEEVKTYTATPTLRYQVVNPYVEEAVSTSPLTSKITSNTPNGTRQYVIVNGDPQETQTNTAMDYIYNSSTLTYSVSGFKNNNDKTTVDNFVVTQNLYRTDTAVATVSDAAKPWRKNYVESINVGTVAGFSGKVKVTINLEVGGSIVCNVNPGTTITESYINSSSDCTGTAQFLTSDYKGNVVSVSYDYGSGVSTEFAATSENTITAKLIPHYIYDNATGKVHLWDNLATDYANYSNTDLPKTSEDPTTRDETTIKILDIIGASYTNGTYFGSSSTISYSVNSTNYPRTVSSNEPLYVGWTPDTEVNKKAYNSTRETYSSMSFTNGDTVEFYIFVEHQDSVPGLNRSLGEVRIEDIMSSAAVSMVAGDVSKVSWAIYKTSDLDKILDAKGEIHFSPEHPQYDATLTPVLTGIEGTTYSDPVYENPETSTGNYVTGFKQNNVKYSGAVNGWTNYGSDKYINEWVWNGKLHAGYTLVLTYSVKIADETSTDPFVSNEANFFGTIWQILGGPNPYEHEFYMNSGGVNRYVDSRTTFLDVAVDYTGTDTALEANKDYTFQINGKVESSLEKPTSNIEIRDVIVSFVLPVGWSFDKTNPANYVVSKWDTNEETPTVLENITIKSIDVESSNGTGTLIRFNLGPQQLHEESCWEYQIVVTAKSPSVEDIFKMNTGGFQTGTTTKTYNDRIYASISVGSDSYRSLATDVYSGKAPGDEVFEGNPADVIFDSVNSSVNFYNYRLIDGSEKRENDEEFGVDNISVYGHDDWDGNEDTVRRLTHYTLVSYRSYTYRPFITISHDASSPINLESDITFNYTAIIRNTADVSSPWSIDEFNVALNPYVAVNGLSNVKLEKLSSDGQTVASEISATVTIVDGSLSEGFEILVKRTDGKPLEVGAGEYYRITIPAIVDVSEFGSSGYGKDYSRSVLYSSKYAYIIAITTEDSTKTTPSEGISSASGTIRNPGYSWSRITDYDSNSYSIFNRDTGSIPSDNRYRLYAATTQLRFVRPSIQPGLTKTAYVLQNDNTWKTPAANVPVNAGSTLKWEIVASNLNSGVTGQTTIENANIYDVLPIDYSLNEVTMNLIVTSSVVERGELTLGEDYNFAYNPVTRTLSFTEIDIAVGETITINFETAVPTTNQSVSINNAYLVPTSNSVAFNAADIQSSRGTAVDATRMEEMFGINSIGVNSQYSIFVFAGTGIGAQKSMIVEDSITGSDATNNLGLGSSVDYTLQVANNHETKLFENLVIVETLPSIDDKKYSTTDSRGSSMPIYFISPEDDISDIIKVYLINGSEREEIDSSDYTLEFGTVSTVTAAMFESGYSGAFTYDALIDSVDAFEATTFNSFRLEYLETLNPGEMIEIVIHATVPTSSDLIENGYTDLTQFNGAAAINTFGFKAKGIDIYDSNPAIVYGKVSEVILNTFYDEDLDGYDNEGKNLIEDVEVNVSIWNNTDDQLAYSGVVQNGESIALYTLEADKDYTVNFEPAPTNPLGNEHYWIVTEDDIDASASHPVGTPQTMVDAYGLYNIDSLAYGDSHDIHAGYYLTGPRISGYVWHDRNQDGQWVEDEEFLPGVEVILHRVGADGEIDSTDSTGIYSTYTDQYGHYYFDLIDIEKETGILLTMDEFFILQVVMPNGYNTFTTRVSNALHDYLYDSHLEEDSFARITRALTSVTLWPTAWTSSNTPTMSVADEAGYVKYFKFWSTDLHVGIYYVEPIVDPVDPDPINPTPTPPTIDTGVINSPVVWGSMMLTSMLFIGFLFWNDKKKKYSK